MNNNGQIKLEWQTPEIIDLDVDQTKTGGNSAWDETMTTIGAPS